MCKNPKTVLESWRKAERTIVEAIMTLSQEVGAEGCLAERLYVLAVSTTFDAPLCTMQSHADEIRKMHDVEESAEYIIWRQSVFARARQSRN